jgi:pimeloyl-ACP methyl ester carboxylesterase
MISEHWRDNDIFLVTHSMGGFLVMRLFGDFADAEWARKCRAAVLVAPPSTRRPDWRPFYDTEIGWEWLRKAPISLEFIYSRDDPTVTQEHSAYVQERLRGRDGVVFTFVDGHQHFLVRELPEVILSAVQRMLGWTATE